MSRILLYLVLIAVFTHGLLDAQQSGAVSAASMTYEDGTITNNIYTNDCFGLSFTIYEGWRLDSQIVGADAKAKPTFNGEFILLALEQPREGPSPNRIFLQAYETRFYAPTVEEFVSHKAHAQVGADPEHRQMLKDVFPADFGVRHFSRADYKSTMAGNAVYVASVFTKFRSYYIGATIKANSAEALDQSVNSFKGISFQEDQVNPGCVMSSETAPAHVALPGRVRVSQEVSAGLLIKKVPPQYPEPARLARIQGQVLLQVLIDKEGSVEDVTLVSGDPALAPSAIDAVKQWKYKPFLLDGQAVKFETQVAVNFGLY